MVRYIRNQFDSFNSLIADGRGRIRETYEGGPTHRNTFKDILPDRQEYCKRLVEYDVEVNLDFDYACFTTFMKYVDDYNKSWHSI